MTAFIAVPCLPYFGFEQIKRAICCLLLTQMQAKSQIVPLLKYWNFAILSACLFIAMVDPLQKAPTARSEGLQLLALMSLPSASLWFPPLQWKSFAAPSPVEWQQDNHGTQRDTSHWPSLTFLAKIDWIYQPWCSGVWSPGLSKNKHAGRIAPTSAA